MEFFEVKINQNLEIRGSITEQMWLRKFMEQQCESHRNSGFSLVFECEGLYLKTDEEDDILQALSSLGKVWYKDAPTVFHELGIIKMDISKVTSGRTRTTPMIVTDSITNRDRLMALWKKCLAPLIDENLDDCFVRFNWYFSHENMVERVRFTENLNDDVFPEAYPYINNLQGFIKDYIESKESVLLLAGPPGTGKTRLIRMILREMAKRNEKLSIAYANDRGAMQSSRLFIEFCQGMDALVLEDIDHDLMSRLEGNGVMVRILGSSDGIIRNGGSKKMIFSTNLPSLKDIDSALVRPGRCYGVIKTRPLINDEGMRLVERISSGLIPEKISGTLAEIYSGIQRLKTGQESMPFNEIHAGFTACAAV